MKKLLIPILALSLLTGCAGANKSVFEGGLSVTASVNNPVTLDQLAAIDSAYGVALVGMRAYFDLRQCKKSEVASINNLCSRYAVKLQLQKADDKAFKAIMALTNFVLDNKQISALSALTAAKNALSDLKNVAVQNGVPMGDL